MSVVKFKTLTMKVSNVEQQSLSSHMAPSSLRISRNIVNKILYFLKKTCAFRWVKSFCQRSLKDLLKKCKSIILLYL